MSDAPKSNDPNKRVVSFHYEKSASFQSFHVDGMFGGIAPTLLINMAVFVERAPLPQRVDAEVGAKGEGDQPKEIHRETKEGIIRELQCNLVMNYDSAKAMHSWLERKLRELERIRDTLTKEE